MKDVIYSLFENSMNLSFEQICLNIIVSAVLGFLIFVSYMISHAGTIYSKKFNASLVILATLTGTVMTVIGNNIALSLGMVGALSIVRFRTAIKDSRDTVYIFWAIIVGICSGVGDYTVALVGSIVTFVVILIFGLIKSDERMLLIIRGQRSKQNDIQGMVFRLLKHKAILRVRNSDGDNVEFIYEFSSRLLNAVEKNNVNITDELFKIGGIEYVNIVRQNDEVSN